LESVFTGNRNAGSNPAPSASFTQTNFLRLRATAGNAEERRGFGDKPLNRGTYLGRPLHSL
jgi:hypothetical protein